MIIKSAKFVTSAARPVEYPPPDLPEIAFAGKSNVGKSSLINTLVNRKHLVKTSSTPGRTQRINFFNINETFMFVDLPGYGYARVPKKIREQWGPMVETYLKTRKPLRGIVVLLDIRREPASGDQELRSWLNYHQIPVLWVLTKADKLSRSRKIKQLNIIAKDFAVHSDTLILFSTKTREGKDLLWNGIQGLIR